MNQNDICSVDYIFNFTVWDRRRSRIRPDCIQNQRFAHFIRTVLCSVCRVRVGRNRVTVAHRPGH